MSHLYPYNVGLYLYLSVMGSIIPGTSERCSPPPSPVEFFSPVDAVSHEPLPSRVKRKDDELRSEVRETSWFRPRTTTVTKNDTKRSKTPLSKTRTILVVTRYQKKKKVSGFLLTTPRHILTPRRTECLNNRRHIKCTSTGVCMGSRNCRSGWSHRDRKLPSPCHL